MESATCGQAVRDVVSLAATISMGQVPQGRRKVGCDDKQGAGTAGKTSYVARYLVLSCIKAADKSCLQ